MEKLSLSKKNPSNLNLTEPYIYGALQDKHAVIGDINSSFGA